MQPKQIAVPGNSITFNTCLITSTIYNNSAPIKVGGNNEGGNTNNIRIRRPNIKH